MDIMQAVGATPPKPQNGTKEADTSQADAESWSDAIESLNTKDQKTPDGSSDGQYVEALEAEADIVVADELVEIDAPIEDLAIEIDPMETTDHSETVRPDLLGNAIAAVANATSEKTTKVDVVLSSENNNPDEKLSNLARSVEAEKQFTAPAFLGSDTSVVARIAKSIVDANGVNTAKPTHLNPTNIGEEESVDLELPEISVSKSDRWPSTQSALPVAGTKTPTFSPGTNHTAMLTAAIAGDHFNGQAATVHADLFSTSAEVSDPDFVSQLGSTERGSSVTLSTLSSLPRSTSIASAGTTPSYQIARAVSEAGGADVEVRLDPVELGKVRISMGARDGQMVALIVAERPETLELLKRNSDDLLSSFSDQGFENATLDFQQQENDGTDASDQQIFKDIEEHLPAMLADTGNNQTQVSSGLDIRI